MAGDLAPLGWEQESPGNLRPGAIPRLTRPPALPLGKIPWISGSSHTNFLGLEDSSGLFVPTD